MDEHVFKEMASHLNMIVDESVQSMVVYKRHPFVYLVEAADDICYNIIDFEDAHRLGILDYECVKDNFLRIINESSTEDIDWVKDQADSLKEDRNESIAYLRAKAIHTLTNKCAEVFLKNKEQILDGSYSKSLITDIPELQSVLKEIEDISIKKNIQCKKGCRA